MDPIFLNSIAVNCPSAALITQQTGKAHLATQCVCNGPYVIVTDCSLSLTTAVIQILAWACEKVASCDFCLGSGFCQNYNKNVNIYNKESEENIILKKENGVHKQSEKK